MNTFSDRLRYLRLQRGYTQQALARACGLSQSAIASYESGQRKSSRAVFQLAKALGVDANWLDAGKLADYGMTASPVSVSDASSLREPDPRNTHTVPGPLHAQLGQGYDALSIRERDVLDQLIAAYIRACRAMP